MSYLSRSYPYPFLGRESDFINHSFGFEIEPQLGNQELILNFSSNLLETPLANLIKSGQIKVGLDIHSPESFHRSFEVLDLGKNSLAISTTDLGGEIKLSPLCVCTEDIADYKVSGTNKEFESGTFSILAGDVVGAGPTTSFFLELDKAAPKSIVRVEQDSSMEPYEYRFELRSNQIAILMGEKTRSVWEAFYSNKETNPFLILSILKDCLLLAMQDIASSDDRDSMYWSKHFISVLESKGIEIDEKTSLDRLNQIAQSLVSDKAMKPLFERARN